MSSSTGSVMRIGKYRLGKTLGTGSFGKVKLGEHEVTGTKVAVKILNLQKIKNSQMDKKIRREIKILKLLRHPHIIRLYEVIFTRTDIFMIMEYVSGGELFDYIVNHGRLKETEARRFFQQIVAGVEYCHRYNVIHRDLKPENILLDEDGNVKIADFGLSNIIEDGDFLRTSCGSPNYAAPEVISGKLYAGPEVDVWSCGVILYALLCGRLPFDEEVLGKLFKKIKEGTYSLPSYLTDRSKDLIRRILVVDPLRRYTISEVRRHDWFVIDLPEYLRFTPVRRKSVEDMHAAIDEDPEVVKLVVEKMGVTSDAVVEAIQTEDPSGNEIAVAYQLLLDEVLKRKHEFYHLRGMSGSGSLTQSGSDLQERLEDSAKDDSDMNDADLAAKVAQVSVTTPAKQSVAAAGITVDSATSPGIPPQPAVSSPKKIVPVDSTSSAGGIPIIGSVDGKQRLPPGHDYGYGAYDHGYGTSPMVTMPVPKPATGSVREDAQGVIVDQPHYLWWKLGLETKDGCFDIMVAVYDVLKDVGCRWKSMAPFQLRVVREYRFQDNSTRHVFLGVHLYKFQNGGYMLGFRKVRGDLCAFMDLSMELWSRLCTRLAPLFNNADSAAADPTIHPPQPHAGGRA